MTTVTGLAFPGGSTAELREFDVTAPGPTEVRISIQASGICGSDLHSYHTDQGLRAFGPGDDRKNRRSPRSGALLIGGHEPAGVVESVGSEVHDFTVGDRVLVYHIMGCGNCRQCRLGYPVVCTSSARGAYGGERNGGHGTLMLAEQRSLIRLPDELSFVDGAMIACGVGTAYSALRKTGIAAGGRLLVTGLGPVGLAVTQLAHDMGVEVIGADLNSERAAAGREHGLDHALTQSSGSEAITEIMDRTGGLGVEAAIDCSGASAARLLCLQASGIWGQVVFVGVGRQELSFDPTIEMIVKMLTVRGSWVSSQAEMQDLAELLARRDLHPESLVSKTYSLTDGKRAYEDFAAGASGKLVFTT